MVYRISHLQPFRNIHKLSYKNCYGLSLVTSFKDVKDKALLSYKNCYGLSKDKKDNIQCEARLSYKNCYGLSPSFFKCSTIFCCYRTKIVMVYLLT